MSFEEDYPRRTRARILGDRDFGIEASEYEEEAAELTPQERTARLKARRINKQRRGGKLAEQNAGKRRAAALRAKQYYRSNKTKIKQRRSELNKSPVRASLTVRIDTRSVTANRDTAKWNFNLLMNGKSTVVAMTGTQKQAMEVARMAEVAVPGLSARFYAAR